MLVENSRSWIDQWKQQGWQEGRQEGRQEGIAQILNQLLQGRFGVLPQWAQQRLQQADADTLTLWATRVLTASTLEQVLAD